MKTTTDRPTCELIKPQYNTDWRLRQLTELQTVRLYFAKSYACFPFVCLTFRRTIWSLIKIEQLPILNKIFPVFCHSRKFSWFPRFSFSRRKNDEWHRLLRSSLSDPSQERRTKRDIVWDVNVIIAYTYQRRRADVTVRYPHDGRHGVVVVSRVKTWTNTDSWSRLSTYRRSTHTGDCWLDYGSLPVSRVYCA